MTAHLRHLYCFRSLALPLRTDCGERAIETTGTRHQRPLHGADGAYRRGIAKPPLRLCPLLSRVYIAVSITVA